MNVPLQKDVDHLTEALWRARVWMRTRVYRKAPEILPVIAKKPRKRAA